MTEQMNILEILSLFFDSKVEQIQLYVNLLIIRNGQINLEINENSKKDYQNESKIK